MEKFFKDLLNVPNSMSLLRIIITPTIIFFWFALDMPITALILGTVAGITDLFDGIVARKFNQVTELGALIDQLGDLVFESTAMLVGVMIGEVWAGVMIIYLFREFTVTVIRTYVFGNGGKLPSSNLGKAKSSLIQYAFFLLFLGSILLRPGTLPEEWTICGIAPGRMMIWIALASLYTGIVVSLISGWTYLKSFARFYVDQIPAKN